MNFLYIIVDAFGAFLQSILGGFAALFIVAMVMRHIDAAKPPPKLRAHHEVTGAEIRKAMQRVTTVDTARAQLMRSAEFADRGGLSEARVSTYVPRGLTEEEAKQLDEAGISHATRDEPTLYFEAHCPPDSFGTDYPIRVPLWRIGNEEEVRRHLEAAGLVVKEAERSTYLYVDREIAD